MYKDEDVCAQCGGIRVAKSTLCVDCLAAFALEAGRTEGELRERIERTQINMAVIIAGKNAEIEDLKYQLRLHKKLIRHIFREYQAVRGIKAVDVIA